MNKYKVLVFGSSGLVGQSLVKTLNSFKGFTASYNKLVEDC